MYLGSDTIKTMLSSNGFDLTNVHIYVSSEYDLTKRSDNLFKTVLRKEVVEAKDVLHIGDHIISDYLNPRRVGMGSVLVRSSY